MKQIIILNGYPRCGKDTFAKLVRENFKKYSIKTTIRSSVDKVKQAAHFLGWDGTKTEANRKALSDLKDLSTKYWDAPFNEMSSLVNSLESNECVIFMVREPEEIEKFVSRYSKTITVFLKRGVPEKTSNHADGNVENYVYDYYIENNGDLTNLASEAYFLVERIIYQNDQNE